MTMPPLMADPMQQQRPRINAAISPEQAATERSVFGGGPGSLMAGGGGFNPSTDHPDDPNRWLKQVKPVGMYPGWAGLASIGEGLHNAAAYSRANQAQGEQRESQRAGAALMQSFMANPDGAAGPAGMAKLMSHPGTAHIGTQLFLHAQERAAKQSDPEYQARLAKHQHDLDLAKRYGDRDHEGKLALQQAQIDYYGARSGLADSKANGGQRMAQPGFAADGTLIHDTDAEQPLSQMPALRSVRMPATGRLNQFAQMPTDDPSAAVMTDAQVLGTEDKAGSSVIAEAMGKRITMPELPDGAKPAEINRWMSAKKKVDRHNAMVDGNPDPAERPGVKSNAVPGVVTVPGGAGGSDKLATDALAGQKSAAQLTNEARARFDNEDRIQKTFAGVYGKPPSGKKYNARGELIPLEAKDTATERQSQIMATQGLETLSGARKTLEGSGIVSQFVGDAMGFGNKYGFGEAARGFKAAESAVLQLNFALSGKSVSNAEREHFQNLYMPKSTDSRETQKWKFDAIEKFFGTIKKARAEGKPEDVIRAEYQNMIGDGQMKAIGAKPSSNGPPLMASPDGGWSIKRVD